MTVCVFAAGSTAAIAASIGDAADCADAVAQMNAMQLLASIAIVSILALVAVVGFYFKSVSAFQKETAAKLAEVTTILREIERQ
jgi:tellurite resistance protein TehA-like permease